MVCNSLTILMMLNYPGLISRYRVEKCVVPSLATPKKGKKPLSPLRFDSSCNMLINTKLVEDKLSSHNSTFSRFGCLPFCVLHFDSIVWTANGEFIDFFLNLILCNC